MNTIAHNENVAQESINHTVRKHFLDRSITTREVIFVLALALCMTPWVSAPLALLGGLIIAQFIGHPSCI
ncbi:hypothetical protein [Chitinophaga pinensis]|uniref:hypothetical protein n=1 Tax=Chitinophaga pinensis TaxID=79329 RepID=UPI0021BDB1BC|nr:hypothetical protein [Chitinophaga pinensis]